MNTDTTQIIEGIKEFLDEYNNEERARTLSAIKEHCSDQRNDLSERLHEGNKKFAEVDKDLEAFKRWQKSQNGSLCDIKDDINGIRKDISSMKHEYLHGRPTWAMMIIISISLTIIGAFVGGIIW